MEFLFPPSGQAQPVSLAGEEKEEKEAEEGEADADLSPRRYDFGQWRRPAAGLQ